MAMEPLQVLRIEHTNGNGIFKNRVTAYDLAPNACNKHFRYPSDCTDTCFPTPREEGLDIFKYGHYWYCAFLSVEQLKSLFETEELSILLRNDFNIFLLTVTEYQKGNHQVLFTKQSITSKENINSLFV